MAYYMYYIHNILHYGSIWHIICIIYILYYIMAQYCILHVLYTYYMYYIHIILHYGSIWHITCIIYILYVLYTYYITLWRNMAYYMYYIHIICIIYILDYIMAQYGVFRALHPDSMYDI